MQLPFFDGGQKMIWVYGAWQVRYFASFWQVYATLPPERERTAAELKRLLALMNHPPIGLAGR
jgi:hypothetical protein